MNAAPQIFDRALLRQRRRRVAAGAAEHDFLLQRVADDLAERLAITQRQFNHVVNLGSHHGILSDRITALAHVGHITDVESSMTPQYRSGADGNRSCVLADEEALPFAAGSLDLVVSALALQFINDLPGSLTQIARCLKPDGLFLAALLGGATLVELREAWMTAETEILGGVTPRVAPFADVRALGGLLQRAGFALPVVDSDSITVHYASPLALMLDVKAMGASNVLVERHRTPVSRRLLARASEIYGERFSRPDGRVKATFEIITLTGWVPHDSQPKPLKPGSATARLADVLPPPRRNEAGTSD